MPPRGGRHENTTRTRRKTQMAGAGTSEPLPGHGSPPPDRGSPPPGHGGPARPSRRQLLAGAGAFGAGAVAGGAAGYFTQAAAASPPGADGVPGDSALTVPFYGPHQSGIATPAQDRLAFGSLNVVAGATRADLRDLLREWTAAAARMARGRLIGKATSPYAPPGGHRRGGRLPRVTADHHARLRARPVRPPVRSRREEARRPGPAAAAAQREPRPRLHRRGPVPAGLLR